MNPRVELARVLASVGAVEIRQDPEKWFTWASGKRSPIYCDNRLLISSPDARTIIADALAAMIRANHGDARVIAGTATAGIPHAAWVADRLGLPMVYVRGEAKGHGRGKRVEGRALAGEPVVLVEDLVSLGGSALSAVDAIEEEGGKVVGVQAIFTYGFPAAAEKFEARGLDCHTLTDYAALLETLDLGDDERALLEAWRRGD